MPRSNQDNKKIQNLSIYLIKENFSSIDDIVQDDPEIEEHLIDYEGSQIGRLFVKKIDPKPPRWSSFFQDCIDKTKIGKVAAVSAALLMEIDDRIFAITFGQGRYLLMTDCWEERFGLRATLNCIDHEKVRCIDKKTLDALTKQSKEQASRDAATEDFGLDIEQDLLRAVTGKPINKSLGSRISGMDSLHVTVKADIGDISEFISRYYAKYNDNSYKQAFPWVDHIAEVKGKSLISQLDNELINNIKKRDLNRIWLAVPEWINWDDVSGFRYSRRANQPEYSDIHLDRFLALHKNTDISLSTLQDGCVFCVNTDGFLKHKWTVYKCLYGEIIYDADTYVLSGGKWYSVDTDFVKAVNDAYKEMPKYDITLPIYNHESEEDYNNSVAEKLSDQYALMDRKFIFHGGGQSKFEFCDLFTANKDMVHVKRYGASSVLSHLFTQGVNSAELFQTDMAFRKKVNDQLPEGYKIDNISKRPGYEEYRVVYAIISDIDRDLEIPFFSKLSLRNAKRRLEGFGYRVTLSKINVGDEVRRLQKIRKRIRKGRIPQSS